MTTLTKTERPLPLTTRPDTLDLASLAMPQVPTTSKVVPTDSYLKLRVRLDETVEAGLLMLVSGVPGVGKTFATGHALADLHAHRGIDWVKVRCTSKPNEKALLVALCESLQIPMPMQEVKRTVQWLITALTEHLRSHSTLVVLDECEYLSMRSLGVLRTLWDTPGIACPMVLIGDPRFAKQLRSKEAALDSRISRRQIFAPLSADEALELMPGYHPCLAATEPAMLEKINHRARGRLRYWAQLLGLATGRRHFLKLGDADGITDELYRLVREDLGWRS